MTAVNQYNQLDPNCFSNVELKTLNDPITLKPNAALTRYCTQNLFRAKNSKTMTTGDTKSDMNNGPKNVLGTTPGNSRWSY